MGDSLLFPQDPRVMQFVDALPKSGAGKVKWRALQEAEHAK